MHGGQAPSAGSEPGGATLRIEAERPASALNLVLFGDRYSFTFPLPLLGEVVLGRAAGVDIVLNDLSISRRHAVLHLQEGRAVEIEDAGSANGTFVGDHRLTRGQRMPLEVGNPFRLGSRVLMLQETSREEEAEAEAEAGPASKDPFQRRLATEWSRANGLNTYLSVARVRAGAEEGSALRALTRAAPGEAAVASDGPREYWMLLPNQAPDAAAATLSSISGQLAGKKLEMEWGVASFPVDASEPALLLSIARARLDERAPQVVAPKGMIAQSPPMRALLVLVERVAKSDINVLLTGESGAGKEVLAEHIHRSSRREGKPFLRLNCAAFTESLLESELFGHERGAFTGAAQSKPGLLEVAEGGTVFFDELAELPLSLQSKLLRVLEERQIRRVGGTRFIPVDVRFVSATNRNLEMEVAEGRFRRDLFFRLNGISLHIPPLRERAEEIEPLARHFLSGAAQRIGHSALAFSPETAAALRRHPWPGNVRELRNVVERAAVLCNGPVILPEHLLLAAPAGPWVVAESEPPRETRAEPAPASAPEPSAAPPPTASVAPFHSGRAPAAPPADSFALAGSVPATAAASLPGPAPSSTAAAASAPGQSAGGSSSPSPSLDAAPAPTSATAPHESTSRGSSTSDSPAPDSAAGAGSSLPAPHSSPMASESSGEITVEGPLSAPPGPDASAEQIAVHERERQRIIDALKSCGGNQSRAARLLGISRNTLIARLVRYGVPRPHASTDGK